ncbi:MAG TPA: hypothetical protein PKD64_08750 [Pirellulaceae bacterium]|nr:hypothetical protein [Pirellulaceae bacterium]HMO92276.1 hypothetical protein [Pirellulaceae bacterium]HMP70094.1 hypothetical protein [Pirellulaceae bacterium]
MNFEEQAERYRREQDARNALHKRLAGTDDPIEVAKKVAQQTGWKLEQVLRWDCDYFDDVIKICLGERAQSDERKKRAYYLHQNGMTWPEVAEIVDGDREGWKSLMQEIKRYAKENYLPEPTGKRGRVPKHKTE